jgi:hypothetical protein
MSKHHTIIIHADGETWTTINGPSICVITDKEFDDLCEGRIDAKDLRPVMEIGLKDFTPYNKD